MKHPLDILREKAEAKEADASPDLMKERAALLKATYKPYEEGDGCSDVQTTKGDGITRPLLGQTNWCLARVSIQLVGSTTTAYVRVGVGSPTYHLYAGAPPLVIKRINPVKAGLVWADDGSSSGYTLEALGS